MRFPQARHCLAAVLVMCLALAVPVTADAADMGATATWDPWASLRRIVENPPVIVAGTAREWSYPDVDGKYAVYSGRLDDADGPGGETDPGDWDIYLRNLNTGVETPIDTGAGDQMNARISGDWVVYENRSPVASWEIKAFKISTRTPKAVTDRPGAQLEPDVSGTKVVYSDAGDVRLYDLVTGSDTLLAASSSSPSISGDRAVYLHSNTVVLASLRGGLGTVLAADAGVEYNPAISGDHVVYIDEGVDDALTAYKISTGGSKTIAPPSGENSRYSVVDGTIAVWRNEKPTGERYLCAYDFMKDKAVTLADPASDNVTQPRISGTRLVCVATPGAGTTGDIALGTIKAPTATLGGSSEVKYGARPVLTGRLAENGEALGTKVLDVLKSTNTGFTWAKVGTATTRDDGSFSYTLPASYTTARYQVRFNGETDGLLLFPYLSRFSALSNVRVVAVRASLGKPAGYPKTGRKSRSYSVYGSLKPRQAATAVDAGVVVIKCYQRKSGKWKYRKTVKAKVYDYDTYSRYRGSVKLPYAGRWRMRAYFKGSSTNAAKYSSYRYVRVE